uniref:Shq1 protein domain-containing protein n=1 Tax=Fagus sylvatica TaxID=28930 RepID=A0A2N9ID27_FAGSY
MLLLKLIRVHLYFLSVGDQVSFDDLSVEEKKRFQRALVSGELSKMIEPWEPWWLKPSARTISLSNEGTQLVQPLAKQDASVPLKDDLESDQSSEIPPGPGSPLPSVSKLSSTEPSPLLAIHLVDILYSYCFTLRLYNGELAIRCHRISLGCVECVLCLGLRHMGGLQFGLGFIDDVISLLSLGTSALVCSLSDLHSLIQVGESELKSEKRKKSRRVEISSKLKIAERKIYFIMCWVYEQPGEAWTSLAAIVGAEKSSIMELEGNEQSVKINNKAEIGGKVLIEEIK